ncbi:uncharacterized protein LOC141784468 [Halichoeres trimaculatus]|uniref:uncharacterized protein LOC141784468 n=1 Tax=Halichoeres trimaculatus TaxID=147232 RepID=UPI003D9ECEB8
MSLTVITAVLCSLTWVSVSGFQTVEIQPGENVTLVCSDMTKKAGVKFWFRLLNGTNIHCISSMPSSTSDAKFCPGIDQDRFKMTSDASNTTLTVLSVKLDDAGLYFCAFYEGSPTFSVKHLKVKGSNEANNVNDSDRQKNSLISSMILGAVSFLLMLVVIWLVVKNRKLQKADKEQTLGQSQHEASADLNYAAVIFRPKTRRRDPEPNVVYAATR